MDAEVGIRTRVIAVTGQYDSPDYTTSAVKRVVRELRSQLNDSSVARLADLRTNALYQLKWTVSDLNRGHSYMIPDYTNCPYCMYTRHSLNYCEVVYTRDGRSRIRTYDFCLIRAAPYQTRPPAQREPNTPSLGFEPRSSSSNKNHP